MRCVCVEYEWIPRIKITNAYILAILNAKYQIVWTFFKRENLFTSIWATFWEKIHFGVILVTDRCVVKFMGRIINIVWIEPVVFILDTVE
jgi:hypothetical protein